MPELDRADHHTGSLTWTCDFFKIKIFFYSENRGHTPHKIKKNIGEKFIPKKINGERVGMVWAWAVPISEDPLNSSGQDPSPSSARIWSDPTKMWLGQIGSCGSGHNCLREREIIGCFAVLSRFVRELTTMSSLGRLVNSTLSPTLTFILVPEALRP